MHGDMPASKHTSRMQCCVHMCVQQIHMATHMCIRPHSDMPVCTQLIIQVHVREHSNTQGPTHILEHLHESAHTCSHTHTQHTESYICDPCMHSHTHIQTPTHIFTHTVTHVCVLLHVCMNTHTHVLPCPYNNSYWKNPHGGLLLISSVPPLCAPLS